MIKQKVLTLLVLLAAVVTGAWAQEQSETIATTDKIVEGTHFTIDNHDNWADEQGMNADEGITVTSKNGETITKVVISCTYIPGSVNDGNTSVSSGTKEITNGGGTITVTGVNASTFTFTCSNSAPQFGQFVVYYTEASAAPAGYTVSMPQDTPDTEKWQAKAGQGKYQQLPLEGVAAGTVVSVKYSGTKRVKSVKAVKEATAPSVPDGAINGKFSVSDGKQVYFSKGNLYYDANATTKWYFAANQYDYIGTATGYPMDLFTWGNIDNPAYDGNNGLSGTSNLSGTTDWGSNIGTGWYTLSSDEWTYLFNTRSASTVGDTENARYTLATINTDGTSVNGIILFPDGATFAASEATTWGTINGASDWTTKCTTAQWTALEAKGCVFLPAAGYRSGSSPNCQGIEGVYWSSTADGTGYALQVYFKSGYMSTAESDSREVGFNVRLVQATSDAAPAKPAATVTTAPTGAAIVGVGKTTELVSGGVSRSGGFAIRPQ